MYTIGIVSDNLSNFDEKMAQGLKFPVTKITTQVNMSKFNSGFHDKVLNTLPCRMRRR